MLNWIMLLIGGVCEVGFVTMMKMSDGFRRLKYSLLTLAFMAASFWSLSFALREIPMGVGYAIWAGIGAVGSVIVGMVRFSESRDWRKLLFITMIIAGIVGLKLTTH